jgi:hypothetical protein
MTPAERRRHEVEWRKERLEWRKLKKPAAAASNVALIDSRCHRVIRASAQRNGWEAVQDDTPLSELVNRAAAEESEVVDAEMELRQKHFNTMLEWIFGDTEGPHPAYVMRRLFGLTFHRRPDLLAYMTMADLGLLLGESSAAFSFRLKQLFPGIPCRSQKRMGAKANYSAAQKGNRNRRRGERRKQQTVDGQNYEHN